MNLYDQLLKLQVIDNAYSEWAVYRAQLTQYVIKELSPDFHLAIWGAGRCYDLDLNSLASHFKAITLLDKNEEALKEALHYYHLDDCPSIWTKRMDFVGISDEDYRQYADLLLHEVRKHQMTTSCHELANIALELLQALSQKYLINPLDVGTLSFDASIMIGVHSQLLSMLEWIWSVILQTLGQSEERVRRAIIQMNTLAVNRLNTALFATTHQKILVGYELQRLGRAGTIQGAYQAIQDVEQRVTSNQFDRLSTLELTWPFNKMQDVNYLMQFETLEINKSK